MNLLTDLLQALLIPLAGWDVRFFGLEATVPVTPLLVIVLFALVDQALRRFTRRPYAFAETGDCSEEVWEEGPSQISAAKS